MWWHTLYWTSLYSMINVASWPKGQTVKVSIGVKLQFDIFSLLSVSQDLDHSGLKGCEATFKDH